MSSTINDMTTRKEFQLRPLALIVNLQLYANTSNYMYITY